MGALLENKSMGYSMSSIFGPIGGAICGIAIGDKAYKRQVSLRGRGISTDKAFYKNRGLVYGALICLPLSAVGSMFYKVYTPFIFGIIFCIIALLHCLGKSSNSIIYSVGDFIEEKRVLDVAIPYFLFYASIGVIIGDFVNLFRIIIFSK